LTAGCNKYRKNRLR